MSKQAIAIIYAPPGAGKTKWLDNVCKFKDLVLDTDDQPFTGKKALLAKGKRIVLTNLPLLLVNNEFNITIAIIYSRKEWNRRVSFKCHDFSEMWYDDSVYFSNRAQFKLHPGDSDMSACNDRLDTILHDIVSTNM
nr:hypothetical protein [Homalodisca vitripennis reovirus]